MSAIFPATSMPDRDWWAASWPDPAGLLLSLGVSPGMTVLDLCCGDGYFTAPLAKVVDGRVYALDLDPDMIELARLDASRQGASVLEWMTAAATSAGEEGPVALPIPQGTGDPAGQQPTQCQVVYAKCTCHTGPVAHVSDKRQ